LRWGPGTNVPFGQGDTPIKEVLQVIRGNQWNIQATIEFEYPIPPSSDRMTELKKAWTTVASVWREGPRGPESPAPQKSADTFSL
jgi:hypothetical protein